MAYKYDIFFSYKHAKGMKHWVIERFLPALKNALRIELKRKVTVFLDVDELDCPFGVPLRQQIAVNRCVDDGFVFHQRQRRPLRTVQPIAQPPAHVLRHVVAVGNSEAQIEALPRGQELGLIAQMPLADDGGGIAARFEDLRDRDLTGIQAVGRNGPQHGTVAWVDVHADTLSIAARHNRCP